MQTTLIISGMVTLILVGLFLIARARLKNIPVVADHKNILSLTDKNFQHQTKNNVVLIDFWAEWCAPCRMQAGVHTRPQLMEVLIKNL